MLVSWHPFHFPTRCCTFGLYSIVLDGGYVLWSWCIISPRAIDLDVLVPASKVARGDGRMFTLRSIQGLAPQTSAFNIFTYIESDFRAIIYFASTEAELAVLQSSRLRKDDCAFLMQRSGIGGLEQDLVGVRKVLAGPNEKGVVEAKGTVTLILKAAQKIEREWYCQISCIPQWNSCKLPKSVQTLRDIAAPPEGECPQVTAFRLRFAKRC